MRWMYARQNPADNLLFGYSKASEVRRQFYLLLWNIYKFYRQNAEVDTVRYTEWTPKDIASLPVLDQWILSRLKQTITMVHDSLSSYDPRQAAEEIEAFVAELSTWYIRRSRDRVGPGATDTVDKQAFYQTMQYVFKNLSIILSPFLPFISEEIYTSLTGCESVHLEVWPTLDYDSDEQLISDMQNVRAIVEVGHRVRKELQIKVRQPLARITISFPHTQSFQITAHTDVYKQLLQAELNVKKVNMKETKQAEITVEYDTILTEELKKEGELRDLVRTIQNKRKKLGVALNEEVALTVPPSFKEYEDYLKKQVQATSVDYAEVTDVRKTSQQQ